MIRLGVVLLSGCLLLTACGAKDSALTAAAASTSPRAAGSPSATAAASEPSAAVVNEPVSAAAAESPAVAVAEPSSAGGTTAPTAEAPPPDHGAALWSTSWRAVERTRGGRPWAFPDNGAWAVGFDGADRKLIRWRGGCNHTGAAVVVATDRLVVDDGPRGSTAAGCDEERTAEDGEAAAFFVSDPTWSRSGDELLLTAADGTVVRLVLATGWPPEPSS